MRDTERARNGTSDVYASAPPLASSVTVPDPTEAPVQALEAVKNVNVTVPVGVPKLPLTVALSCTVVPAGTEATTAWLASWIARKGVGEGEGVDIGGHRLFNKNNNGVSCDCGSGVEGGQN